MLFRSTISYDNTTIGLDVNNKLRVINPSSVWNTNVNKIYYNNGYVGIGTNNPLRHLHLHSSINESVAIHFTDSATGNTITDGTIFGKETDGSFSLVNNENTSIKFYTNATFRGLFNANGSFELGTIQQQNMNGSLILSRRDTLDNINLSRQYKLGIDDNKNLSIGDFGNGNEIWNNTHINKWKYWYWNNC